MKFWRAFNIFLFLLQAKEWYIIADNDDNHLKDAHISISKLTCAVNTDIEDTVACNSLIHDANNILNNNNN